MREIERAIRGPQSAVRGPRIRCFSPSSTGGANSDLRILPDPGQRTADLGIHQLQRILHHRHHAEAEQIDLDDAHVGAVVLVPLDDDAARHAGVLERDDLVEPALADHHAAGMLAEMPRQILDLLPQLRRTSGPSACCTSMPTSRRLRSSVSFGSTHSKWFITLASRSTCAGSSDSDLPDFARGAAAAIGDDVRRHPMALGGAELPVLLVDVLDDALAAIAARQIEIDVRPLAALLRQEPLEQQLHPDRIDGGDAEAVADGAVGRRAAPLHEDVLLPAELTMSQTIRK